MYVLKRPGVDDFMKAMGEVYEIVIFTASLSKVISICQFIIYFNLLVSSLIFFFFPTFEYALFVFVFFVFVFFVFVFFHSFILSFFFFQYADPVLDQLDIHKVVNHRLFRESCYFYKGNYVKDLSRLGRDIQNVLIIDNSPSSYLFHPENALPVTTWLDDPNDNELAEITDFLIQLSKADNMVNALALAER